MAGLRHAGSRSRPVAVALLSVSARRGPPRCRPHPVRTEFGAGGRRRAVRHCAAAAWLVRAEFAARGGGRAWRRWYGPIAGAVVSRLAGGGGRVGALGAGGGAARGPGGRLLAGGPVHGGGSWAAAARGAGTLSWARAGAARPGAGRARL